MSKTRIPTQSASAEYLRTMERKKVARRIRDMGETLDGCAVILPPYDGVELADEEVSAIKCGISTGLAMALVATEEIEEDCQQILEGMTCAGYAVYLDHLKESDG